MVGNCKLVIDTREKHVTRHDIEFKNTNYEIKQITTGDYAIMDEGLIKVIIERKSLDDAAASIRDGRWENRDKLIALREKVGCAIVFIIEGLKRDNYEYVNQMCGKYMLYSHLESSIFHMMFLDNISTVWTKDTVDTARVLCRMVASMNTAHLRAKKGRGEEPIVDIPPAQHMELLTEIHRTSDLDHVREMWQCFKGIASTADDFMKKYTIGDIVAKKITKSELEEFKLASGKRINKKIATRLLDVNRSFEVKLLSKVPGVSLTTAGEIIDQHDLAKLLTFDVGAISIIKVGKTKRNLGEAKAQKIKDLFVFKIPQPE